MRILLPTNEGERKAIAADDHKANYTCSTAARCARVCGEVYFLKQRSTRIKYIFIHEYKYNIDVGEECN